MPRYMLISDLIPILAQKYLETTRFPINKTKLIKIAYLAEVFYKRFTGNRLTDQEWLFWKYGPYFHEYDGILSDSTVFELSTTPNDFVPVIPRTEFEPKPLSVEENAAILRALDRATADLNEILDYVYFDTEPMVAAERRGEVLNFDSILPKEVYIVRDIRIRPERIAEIQKKVQEWKAKHHYA